MRHPRADRGSATVELVLLAPVFALLFAFVVAVGRAQSGHAEVEAAASAAVRSITLARDPAAAIERARSAAEASLSLGSATCRTMGWEAEVTPERATVTVSCTVDLADAAVLPLPGTYTVSATADEILDVHRERAGSAGAGA